MVPDAIPRILLTSHEAEIPIADEPWVMIMGSLYILMIVAIGAWGWTQTDDIHDFLITGKSLGIWVVALTIFSVIQSGFGFIGGPELLYEFGTSALWIFFTAPLGFLAAWVLVGKRMRILADVRDVLTLADGMFVRYDSDWVRGLTGLVVVIAVLGYLAVNLAALQFVMRAIFGIPLIWGLFGGGAIILFYALLGGMIAGVWTDFVQGITMIIGGVVVFAFAMSFGGGMGNISQNLAETDPSLIGPFGALGAGTAVAWWLLFSLGSVGQVHSITKFYMISDVTLLKWGAPIAAISYGLSSLLAFSTGLAMRAMVEAGEVDVAFAPTETMPVFVIEFTPGLVAGLILAGLLAAIMSTSDSFLNIAAAAITRDIPRSLGRPIQNDHLELRLTQLSLAALTIGALLIVHFSEALVGILGVIGWGLFAASIFPVVALGLNWKGATPAGAVAALVIGLVFNLWYDVLPTALEILGQEGIAETVNATYPFPEAFVVGTAAMLISTIAFIVVSFLTQDDHVVPRDVAIVMER